jgi:hypothetical protein
MTITRAGISSQVGDMNETIQRFGRDLLEAGVVLRQRAVLMLLYDRALSAGSPASWARLYRTLFSALRLLTEKRPDAVKGSRRAIDSLLRILEDDFGAALFGPEATLRLRWSLEWALPRERSTIAGVVAPLVASTI